MKRAARCGFVCAALIIAAGCQTAIERVPEEQLPPLVQFQPARYKAQIAAGQGRYKDLFASESYALWIGSQMAAVKWDAAQQEGVSISQGLQEDAVTVTNEYIIIELHLESVFGDPSIAYDAVGLRNMDVYLEMPNGERILPVQKLFQGSLDEEQEGALKRFGRTMVLIFPKRDLWLRRPTLEQGTPEVRLILDSHYAQFAFTWPAADSVEAPPPTAEEKQAAVRVAFKDLYERVRRLAGMLE